MDLFNARALAAAESRCAALERELEVVKSDLSLFKFLVRDIDTTLFNLSQCTSDSTMRPHIAALVQGMEHRRRAESNRINTLIMDEL